MATFQQPPQPIAPGTQGRPVTVKTNSFVVTSLPKKTFYHYDVIVKLVHKGVAKNDPPTRKQVKLQQRYMEIINKMHDENPREFQPRPSYDGVKNMFSSVKHQNKTFHVTMPGGKQRPNEYEVSIKLVNELGPHLFQELIRPGSHMIETVTQRSKPIAGAPTDIAPLNKNVAAVMLLQVVVTQAPHIHHKFSLHSRSFYIESRAKPLSGGLEALPGFFQSVRPVLGKYLINVDTTTAAFYKAGSLLKLAAEHLGVMDYRNLANALGSRAKQSSLRTFLRGLKVIVVPGETNINMRPNPDLHRVVDIKDLHYNVGSITFNGPNGEETIKDYWERVHQSRLTCPDAFGISSGRDAIFPAEKCYVVAGQRFSRKLSPNDMRQFLGLAVSQPQARIDSIEKAIQGEHLDYRNSSWIHDADIRIDSRALQIQGREISPPQIGYGGKRDLNVARGQWNVMRQKFFVPREIKAMAVLDFDSQSQNIPRHVDAFITKLLDNLEALGIKVLRDKCLYRTGNQQNPRASLEMTAREASSHLPPNTRPDMIVVILPAEAGPIRHAIKYWGDVYYGLATQCVRNGKYNRGGMSALDQYCNNVALKINTKLGGTNSIFRFPAVENCLTHSMVVGCDISHPAPGVRNRPSIASLVASIDSVCTRYTAHVRCQEPRQEVIEDLKGMLGDAITDFRGRFNGNVPKRIIIFRDGVSEGEYQRVLDNEINKQVEAALWALNPRPPYKPQIVFIVVGKRHHVRFFPVDRSSGDSKGNCNPGLVVDTEIVHSQYQSFYLLSHAGILGTSRPSHYVVLRNDPKWNADELQAISYALCHVYAPATRSVSIPAPVYYADKLCTHAVDQFEPEGDEAHYDDSLSGVGSHDNEMFNLEAWKARLKPANEAVRQRMYYV